MFLGIPLGAYPLISFLTMVVLILCGVFDGKQGDFYKMISKIKDWVKSKGEERTSWDGTMLIAIGVIYLMFTPLMDIVAWIAIIYGAWTLWKDE
tara:strand:- start:914 stop:1195 length:282 start_codon:yes stop_codon:yes gene_type:complete